LGGCSRGWDRGCLCGTRSVPSNSSRCHPELTGPDGVFRVARTAPVGPTHAVCVVTGAAVCGIKAEVLEVLNEDWEAA
jgi:hypothetical protein